MAMTPDEWRDHLYAKLLTQAADRDRYQKYYDGLQKLPKSSSDSKDSDEAREKYARFARESMTNWCALVVDATVERMKIVGFRFSDKTPADGETTEPQAAEGGDSVAWDVWQASRLDSESKLAILDAATIGSSYMLCWPTGATGDGKPKVTITVESGVMCVVEYEDGSRWARAAGLKSWRAINGDVYATLYLPDATYKWVSPSKADPTDGFEMVGTVVLPNGGRGVKTWNKRDVAGEPWPLPNDAGVVPLVELRPRPDMHGKSRSELAGGILDIQDRINDTVFNRLVAGEFGAFMQRWATGMEMDQDEQGNPKSPFKIGADQLWVSENELTKFGQFQATELANYIGAVEADVTHLAAITKTPPHYLLGALVNSSGDALTASETGLVAKVRDRMAFIGEDIEEVMRTAFKIAGDDVRADDFGCEVLWADPEKRSMAELADAVLKLSSIGVPREVLWRKIGASPQEVIEWKDMAMEDAIRTAIAQAPPQEQPQPTPPTPRTARSLPAAPPEAVIAGG